MKTELAEVKFCRRPEKAVIRSRARARRRLQFSHVRHVNRISAAARSARERESGPVSFVTSLIRELGASGESSTPVSVAFVDGV